MLESIGGFIVEFFEVIFLIALFALSMLYVCDRYVQRRRQLKFPLNTGEGGSNSVKIIASWKILTPDDVIITMGMGADADGIARGFMMSGGCIRARQCAETGKHACPVGMATRDPKRRASYLVVKEGGEIANDLRNLIKRMKTILAVMGLRDIGESRRKHLTYKTATAKSISISTNILHKNYIYKETAH